ncbi:hypothetical protein ACSBR2_035507 [Camellia fascicularis]
MSLHLGNLSSRAHRDKLERVFRRFGLCNVQLKDGFGFVVYDFPTNAEKALRALRGKNICGEPITLSWSNRQPRPLQRFSRGNRSYETQPGRKSARGENYGNRELGSKGRQDYKIGFKHPVNDGGRLNSADMVDEVTSNHQNNIKEYKGEKHHNLREDLHDEGNNVQRNLMDNDRWEERVGVPSNEIEVEGGLEFDRYEPDDDDDDDDRRDEDGDQQVTHSGSSPTLRKSQDKIGREQMGKGALSHLDDLKSHQTCYICGELGHKMRSCPQENVSWRKKFSRFDRRCDNDMNFRAKVEGDMKRFGSKSQGRLVISRDAVLMTRHKSNGKTSRLRKHRRLIRSGNSQVKEETCRGAWRKDYVEKKHSRRENGTPERRYAKKARGSVSSPVHSEYPASRSLSLSKPSKFVSGSGSHLRSRSISSRTCSSSRSRSGSTSQYSGSGNYKSRARSRSSSPTSLSVSVSLGRPLPSSPNKIHMNQKCSLVDATCHESKEIWVEQAQLVEGDAGSDNSKLETMKVAVENNNAIAPFKVEEQTEKDNDEDNNRAISKVSSEVKNSCIPLLEKCDVTVESLSPQSLGEMSNIHNSDVLVTEQVLVPTKRSDSEALMIEHLSAPIEKPDPEASVKSSTSIPTSISSEEWYMVLKHYGLDHPVENEKDLPVEAYFGTARLWPWEIIYYRRLRKGPISAENYSRRIAQNQQFGIIDKYIRSSSGWGELGQENL